jgi:hypothetical protein
MKEKTFIKKMAKVTDCATFCTISDYRKSNGETSDYSIIYNFDYKTAVNRSINKLSKYVPANDLESKAKEELIADFYNLLSNSKDNTYDSVHDDNGKIIKGCKRHRKTGDLYLTGLVVHKKVNYNAHNDYLSIKDKLLAMYPVGKIRQFKLSSKQMKKISIQNQSIIPPV